MNRIIDEPKLHIHGEMASAINQAIIDIKIHHLNIEAYPHGSDQRVKIEEARKKHHCPTWPEVIELLEQARTELDNCAQPFKRR